MENIVIETKGLCKSFLLGSQEIKVLNNINLIIEKGKFYSIMGPSGAGKSTLLYLLGGLDDPTSGVVKVDGKDMAAMKDNEKSKMRRKYTGFIFQFYNLVPNLNVEDNVMLPILLDSKKINMYKDDLEEVLNQVGLYDKRKFTPRQLSGGQQQRVAIARALINKPDIIFADEPIGNLDSKSGMEVMELLQKINIEQNKTIIQVTHSKEASEYGADLLIVTDGRIIS
jgi:putative ABC transport system ATP-binding protein